MDSTLPVETAESDHEWEMRFLKRSILENHSYGSFLKELMRQSAEHHEGWESAAEELADIWESRRSGVPLRAPRELDVRRAAFELMEFFWPIFMEWREGFVDQSELHILVRSGGMDWVKDEGERIDVAVIGHCDGGLVVEFLPMFGVDPDAAMAAKRHAVWLLDLVVRQARVDAWSYAKHHCGTASNAYSEVRFVGRGGRKALKGEELHGSWDKRLLVGRQPPVAEHAGESVRTVLRNDGQGLSIEVQADGETFRASLLDLRHDCFTLFFCGPPVAAATMCRTIFAPYERGYLVDDRGHATDYALALMGELTRDLGHDCRTLAERIDDLREAVATARKRYPATSGDKLLEEAFVRGVRDCIVGPPIGVELAVFCNIIAHWLRWDILQLRTGGENDTCP